MKVILQHAGKWLSFDTPKRVLRAERVEQVIPMLEEAEESGLYAAGFISYEASAAFDEAFRVKTSTNFPLLCFGLFENPVVLDELGAPQNTEYSCGQLVPSVLKSDYLRRVEEVKQEIAAGATYQVNYTYRLTGSFAGDPFAFFSALVASQQTAHAAYVELDDYAICSASPELFFSLSEGELVARPMKGTAPRGCTLSGDWAQAEMLRHSQKDRAENIMIVDMLRNDIGRVAQTGSVSVPQAFEVEKYPTCWQMTSTVRGKTEQTASVVLKHLFPCASITGAPKAKTMELIAGLESTPRKVYTGSIGFMTPHKEACFNVAIRTALIDRLSNHLEFGVGGGIVWDSDAAAEYEETLTKARVLTAPRPEFRLLETMLWEEGRGIFLLESHVHRMAHSAAFFDVPFDRYVIEQELNQSVAELRGEAWRIRLFVDREGRSEVQTFPFVPLKEKKLKVKLASNAVNDQDLFLYHKTTNRTVYESALAANPACDDVLLYNQRGEITEGCLANVVIKKSDGLLVTPPVGCGLLAGTFRSELLRLGEIEEQLIEKEDLLDAQELFLVNSVRKWQRFELLV